MAEPLIPRMFRLTSLGGSEETTAGTAMTISVPLASTVLYDIALELQDVFADNERLPMGNFFGEVNALKGKVLGKLTFRQELRYGDKFVPMLTSAGYKLTSGHYDFTSDMSARKTWTFMGWHGGTAGQSGRFLGIKGCAGNCRITGAVGGRAFAAWEFMGVFITPTDASMPTNAPINATSYINTGLTLTVAGAAAPPMADYEINLGNTVSEREDLTATGGVLHYLIEEAKPRVTLNPEMRLVADNDDYGALLASTTAALNLVLGSGSQTLTFAAGQMQRRNITGENRKGKRVDRIEYSCNVGSAGDDFLRISQS